MKSKHVNFFAVNAKTATHIIVSFLSVGVITRALGLNGYADLTLVLTVVAATGMFGNAVVDACVKKVMQLSKRANWGAISIYLSSAVFSIAGLTSIFSIGAATVFLVTDVLPSSSDLLFLLTFAAATMLTLVSGVFRVGSFYVEKFSAQSAFHIFSRLLYLAVLAWLVSNTGLGKWAVAIASLAAAVALAATLYGDFLRHLPHAELRGDLVRKDAILELTADVGHMLLVYAGIYLSSSAALLISKSYSIDESFFVSVALAASVGAIANQILTSFSYIAIPRIHRFVAGKDIEAAVEQVQNANAAVMLTLLLGLLFVHLNGAYLISVWLGHPVEQQTVLIIVAGCASLGINALGVQWSNLCAATKHISMYGALTLAEGALSIAAAAHFLKSNTFYGCLLAVSAPGAFFLVKVLVLQRLLPFRAPLRLQSNARELLFAAAISLGMILAYMASADYSAALATVSAIPFVAVGLFRALRNLR